MNNLCVIPARGGSRRIKGKNIKSFHGKPIIAYSIDAAIASGLFDKIVVSTDSHEIAKVAYDYGAEVNWRSEELSVNEVGTQEVARAVLADYHGYFDKACIIYPCSPLLDSQFIDIADKMLDDSLSYCISIGDSPLQDAGNFYYGWAEDFINGEPIFGMNTRMITLPKERVCDINTESDWALAEKMYGELHGIS